MRKFGLIIVGDEILSGRRKDQHLPAVIERLTSRGLRLAWCQSSWLKCKKARTKERASLLMLI